MLYLGATAERVPRKSPQGDASEAGIIVYLDERAVCETDVKATIGHVARLRLRSKTTEAAETARTAVVKSIAQARTRIHSDGTAGEAISSVFADP